MQNCSSPEKNFVDRPTLSFYVTSPHGDILYHSVVSPLLGKEEVGDGMIRTRTIICFNSLSGLWWDNFCKLREEAILNIKNLQIMESFRGRFTYLSAFQFAFWHPLPFSQIYRYLTCISYFFKRKKDEICNTKRCHCVIAESNKMWKWHVKCMKV